MSSLVPRTRGAWSTSTQGARKLEPVETFLKEVRSSGWVGGRGAWFKEPGYWQRRSWFRDKLPKPKQLQWVLPFPSMGDSWVTYTVINCLPWLSPGQRLLMGNQAKKKKKKFVHVLSLSLSLSETETGMGPCLHLAVTKCQRLWMLLTRSKRKRQWHGAERLVEASTQQKHNTVYKGNLNFPVVTLEK